MPTLLQINSSVNTGSTGRIAEQLGQFVMNKGWKSIIAYGRKNNPGQNDTIKIGNNLNVIFHGIESRLFDNHGLGSRFVTRCFIKEIEKIKPDIIHLHNIHGYFINYRILFEFLADTDIPVVWTLHDCWPITGHCSYFSDINCLKWKEGCYKCPKTKNYPSSILLDRSNINYKLKRSKFNAKSNLTIVTVSKWLGSIIKDSYLSNFPIKVINNGVDINKFTLITNTTEIKNRYNISDKFLLIGLATTWDSRKGLDDYFKLRRMLSDEYIIILVGLSKKQKQNLPEKIIGIERTESLTELVELYIAADIVLNLSYQETFGMTTAEGFACGTPGIVYNCTASPELITEETGSIVEPGNITQLISEIEAIKSKGKKHYTSNCIKRAKEYYDKEARFNDYHNLYKKLLLVNH